MIAFPVLSESEGEGAWVFRIRVPEDSPYFAGHFPGAPVLPAVAHFAFAAQLLGRMLGKTAVLARVSRVRFRSPVGPGDELDVRVVRASAGDSYRFTATRGDALVSDGSLAMEDEGDGR